MVKVVDNLRHLRSLTNFYPFVIYLFLFRAIQVWHMYLILVYDIREARVYKVLKIARKYLNWVQNSVLEGEISDAGLAKLKQELKDVINPEEDSVLFYLMRTRRYTSREVMGIQKGTRDMII
jgi:CRISPR-associated protein Cas2